MTSSPLPGLRGSQTPRVSRVPPYRTSAGIDAVELASACGVNLDPWQQAVLLGSLGERPDGRWSAFEVGLVVARQNGKGEVLLARELAGLFLFGERLIVHTAHLFPTAVEAFLRIKNVIEGSDDLSRHVKAIHTANGAQSIVLKNGNRLKFLARGKGAGRGFTGDLIILDEAYDLPIETVAAILPTLSAVPNPQIWYASSAGMADSDQLNGVRRRAIEGSSPRLAYFEWSAERGVDLDDREAWCQANPALGIRITEEFIEGELQAMTEAGESFARERLSIWSDARTESVLPMDAWDAAADPMQRDDQGMPIVGTGSVPVGKVVLAVDVPPSRDAVSIAAAGIRPDKRTHLELCEQRPLVGAVQRIAEMWKTHRPRTIVIDPGSPAGSFIPELTALGVKLTLVSTREYGQACGALHDAVVGDRVRHLKQTPLDLALLAAKKRTLGDAWAWDRKDGTDISPLVAVTLAKHGLDTTRSGGALSLIQ